MQRKTALVLLTCCAYLCTVQLLAAVQTECPNVTVTREEASRYGNCVPYSNENPTPCDVLYTVGVDYVYIPFTRVGGSIRSLNRLATNTQIVVGLLPTECLEPARKLLCLYYFPPCGNSTHFQPPQSLCQEQCDYVTSDLCSDVIDTIYQHFEMDYILDAGLQFVNCTEPGEPLEPLDYCCTDANLTMTPVPVMSPTVGSDGTTAGEVQLAAVLPPVLIGSAVLVAVAVTVVLVVVGYRKRNSETALPIEGITERPDMLQNPPPLPGICVDRGSRSGTPVARYISDDVQIWLRPPKESPSAHQLAKVTSGYLRSMSEEKLLIPGRHIQLLDKVGQGEFGVVYRGHLTGWEGIDSAEVVAVKTLRDMFSPKDINDLMAESLKMKSFEHRNILSLIGVCIDAGPAPYLVMPFMAAGSLLSYLKKERPHLTITPGAREELVLTAEQKLLSMCLQVTKGMQYLAGQKFVHRDLAARNCMIDCNFVIKVADFGLSEDIYAVNYFRQGQLKDSGDPPVKLPVRWMALESLTDGIFTEKTDVWSFGVTMWEVFSLGKTPYPAVDPLTLVKLLENGQRLEKPTNAACTNDVFDMMLTCWDGTADKRPTFTDLVQSVTVVLEGISGYMDFSAISGEQCEVLPGYDHLEAKRSPAGALYDRLATEDPHND